MLNSCWGMLFFDVLATDHSETLVAKKKRRTRFLARSLPGHMSNSCKELRCYRGVDYLHITAVQIDRFDPAEPCNGKIT